MGFPNLSESNLLTLGRLLEGPPKRDAMCLPSMPMSQLTIVTGGTGFIGSHLLERLARSRQTVRVIERPGTNVDHLLAEVEVVFADIRDCNALATALKGGRWIYHLARYRN